MAKLLTLEGPQPYVTSPAQAARWGEEGRGQRDARRQVRGVEQEAARRVRSLGEVERLAEDGRLRKEQVQAALDIRAYWAHWRTCCHARVSDHLREVVGQATGGDPVSAIVRANRYRPWAEAEEAVRVRGEVTRLQMVLDLVERDWSPWRLRCEYRMRATEALASVQISLLDYARRAGWVQDRDAA